MAGTGALSLSSTKGSRGVLFLLGADLAYTVYSGTNSSPQTTDVFGDEARIGSLWKYVRIGAIKTAFYCGIAAVLERSWWPLIGGGLAGGSMHLLYRHAAACARQRHGTTSQPAGSHSAPRPGFVGVFSRTPPRTRGGTGGYLANQAATEAVHAAVETAL